MVLSIKVFSNHISMGNQLLFTPFLRAIKSDYPDSYLTTDSKILIELVPELIDEYNGFAKNAIILLPNIKLLIQKKLKRLRTIGFQYRIKGKFFDYFLDESIEWDWSLHEADNNRKFLKIFDASEKKYELKLRPFFPIPKPGNLIAVYPGGRFDKRWPAKNFAEICDILIDNGFKVALFGGPEEKNLSKTVRDHMKNTVYADYTGMTTLTGVISLLDSCDFFFGNDGGLMHITSALKKPIVAIFGPTDFIKNRPFNKPYFLITQGLECSPCYHFSIINCVNPEKFACLELLTVDKVYNILSDKIKEAGIY